MAQFPAIAPDERSYTLGEPPTTEFRGEGGVAIRFKQGTLAVGQTLSLPYTNRPSADRADLGSLLRATERHFHTAGNGVVCAFRR